MFSTFDQFIDRTIYLISTRWRFRYTVSPRFEAGVCKHRLQWFVALEGATVGLLRRRIGLEFSRRSISEAVPGIVFVCPNNKTPPLAGRRIGAKILTGSRLSDSTTGSGKETPNYSEGSYFVQVYRNASICASKGLPTRKERCLIR